MKNKMAKWSLTNFVQFILFSISMRNVLEMNPNNMLIVASVTFPPRLICTHIIGLSPRQMRFCEKKPTKMEAITNGYELGVKECKYQFRKRRWNCTSLGSKHTFSSHAVPGTKESAFTHAIISAGIAHAVTLECTKGNFSKCGCGSSKNPQEDVSTSSWGAQGCSVNIKHGTSIANEFLNGQDTSQSDIALMNKHNNRLGGLVLRGSLKLECRCHGPSASCVTETCWHSLPAFREIGEKTLNKVDSSQRVRSRKVPSRSGMRDVDLLLDNSGSNTRKPNPLSLVYISKSPTYCEPDFKLKIVGTSGRICNRTTTDADNCGLLCCGRGYDTHEMTKRWLCNCRFEWCCRVICKKCKKDVEVTRCK